MPKETAKPTLPNKLGDPTLNEARHAATETAEILDQSERSIAEANDFIDRSEDVIAAGKALLKNPTGKQAEPLTPDEQKRRFVDLCEMLPAGDSEARSKPKLVKKAGPDDGLTQSERFIKARS